MVSRSTLYLGHFLTQSRCSGPCHGPHHTSAQHPRLPSHRRDLFARHSRNYLLAFLTDWQTHCTDDAQPRVNLYGPAGLRTFLRTILSLTSTKTADRYAVHELLTRVDARTPCDISLLHDSEEPGQDMLCDEAGFWRDFVEGRSTRGSVIVCAGPLVHR